MAWPWQTVVVYEKFSGFRKKHVNVRAISILRTKIATSSKYTCCPQLDWGSIQIYFELVAMALFPKLLTKTVYIRYWVANIIVFLRKQVYKYK